MLVKYVSIDGIPQTFVFFVLIRNFRVDLDKTYNVMIIGVRGMVFGAIFNNISVKS
jgi:hypothetical protein